MAGRVVDLEFDLLDRQIVDIHGNLVGKVDDVELTFPIEGGAPYVSGLHSGSGALARRLTRRFVPWLESIAARLTQKTEPNLVSFAVVQKLGTHVDVVLERQDMPGNRLEDFVSKNIIGHIPGARHASE